jgi:nucleoside-specific outer membrane channel protein Tsx
MNPSRLRAGLLLAGCLLPAVPAVAGDWLQWHDNSLTYLAGRDYTVNPHQQQTLTFEHANGWKYGDTFLFVDVTAFNGEADPGVGGLTWYGEFAPRFSLGKLSGRALVAGPVKDVLLATAYEFGEGDVESWLVGPGIDLAVPGFDYVQLNVYRRHPRYGDGDAQWQVTPVWAWTVPVGRSDLLVDGFVDWVVDNDRGRHAHLHFNPQVKYDLGKAMGWGGKTVYVGVEYDYWKNKFGIDDDGVLGRDVLGGTNQNTASVLLKVHLP